jgi:catechol 2,3-dioxygenase-like lactoylglutathione lyase family enzyme
MTYQIQVIIVPVSDVDQALAFYTKGAGFVLDVDYHPAVHFRVVQLTPRGSACSIQIGIGLTDAPPGSASATYLAVTDIEAAHRELARARRPGQRRPAQITDRRLDRRLAARRRLSAP